MTRLPSRSTLFPYTTLFRSRLEKLGAVFVEEEAEIPEGEICVLSAHGVAPAVKENAERRGLRVVDATCPLVNKVQDRKSTRLNSSHANISYAVVCLKKKTKL